MLKKSSVYQKGELFMIITETLKLLQTYNS